MIRSPVKGQQQPAGIEELQGVCAVKLGDQRLQKQHKAAAGGRKNIQLPE